MLSQKANLGRVLFAQSTRTFSSPFQYYIRFLNIDMFIEFSISFGTVCHNELPRNAALCMAQDTVLALGKFSRLFTHKLYDVVFCTKIVFMNRLRPEYSFIVTRSENRFDSIKVPPPPQRPAREWSSIPSATAHYQHI